MIIQAPAAVIGQALVASTWIEVVDSYIVKIGKGTHPNPDHELSGILLPGFIDMHCHGGGGYYFSSKSNAEIEKVISTHRAHGSTGIVASLVTEPISELKRQILQLRPFHKSGKILGIHLEGPYLSHAQCGAHNPLLLLKPKIEEIAELVALAEGALCMVTIAPELPGAIEAIKYLTSQGVRVAIGHTDGDFGDAANGTDAGATIVTHYTNAMKKDQGTGTISSFVLEDERLMVELILDGHHIPFATAIEIFEKLGSRSVLISDAMAAAASLDGDYLIGNLEVTVNDGVARLNSNSVLAGSTLTLSQAFLNAIYETKLSIPQAVALASTNPAKALGQADRGAIAVGMRADLLCFDSENRCLTLIDY